MIFKEIEVDLPDSCTLQEKILKKNIYSDECEKFKWLEEKSVLVIKMRRYFKANAFGVKNKDGSSDSLSDHINQDEVLAIQFVIVMTKENRIYYTGSLKVTKNAIKLFFDLNYVKIISKVNYEQFVSLNRIVLKTTNPLQICIDDDNYLNHPMNDIMELSDDMIVSCAETSFNVRVGGILKRQSLKKFIESKKLSSEIRIYGFDKNNNKISYASNKSSVSFEMYEPSIEFVKAKKLKEEKIYDDLLEKIEEK